MAVSTRSEFIDFIIPLKTRLDLYDRSKQPNDQPKNDAADPTRAIPQGFMDAMTVRTEVFVKEQGVALENELDEDDARSFHWTVYASMPARYDSAEREGGQNGQKEGGGRRQSSSTKIPIGTIRLVPPPHFDHPNGGMSTDVHKAGEAYIKLGRLAVIKEFRKAGISKLLIDTAMQFIREHPNSFNPQPDANTVETYGQHRTTGDFTGLILVHAQTGVQKVWKRYGFETDASMGTWMEEGIEHIGMWKRLDTREARRKSRILLPTSVKGDHVEGLHVD